MRKIRPNSDRYYLSADGNMIFRDEPDEDDDEDEDNGGDEEDEDDGNDDGYSE
ncbi:MAG: hypothetical protein WCC37_21335 [Candidatus Sulfotelmatobacter sp.]|jgi:hypothetical protein